MKVKLLGFKKVNFDSTEGNSIQGTKIFVANKERNVVGMTSTSFWVSDSNFSNMVGIDLNAYIDKAIEVEVDLRGKLVYISG